MRFSRWPAVIILAGLIVAAWVIDQDHDREATQSVVTETPLEAEGFLPVAPPADALSSTWYCAGGTVGEGTAADTSIVVANGTDAELVGTATIFPSIPSQIVITPDAAESPEVTTGTAPTTTTPASPTTASEITQLPVTVDVTVPAYDRIELRLADSVEAEYAAALVEVPGGAVAVEQRVDGPNGADVSPCTTQASDSWYFADGRTTADAVEALAFFNPFPDPAVVDVTFRTEEDLRTPIEFDGYAVPAQSLVVEDIGDLVTRRDHVSISVEGRSGRLVVNRILDLDGSGLDGARGVEVSAGAARPANSWYFPDGIVGEGLGVDETYVVYNPGDTVAEVVLEIIPDELDRFGAIEPFVLSIPPQAYQEVSIQDEERIATAISTAEGEPILRHSALVASENDVPVVVERAINGGDTDFRPGYDLMFGSPLLMEQAVVAASSTNESLVIVNPSGSTPVRVSIRGFDGGSLSEATAVTDLAIPPANRLVVDPAEVGLPEDTALLVEADGPVVVERQLVLGEAEDISGAIAVPLAGTVSEPQRFG